jgi:hypothetical protein
MQLHALKEGGVLVTKGVWKSKVGRSPNTNRVVRHTDEIGKLEVPNRIGKIIKKLVLIGDMPAIKGWPSKSLRLLTLHTDCAVTRKISHIRVGGVP